MVHGEMVLIESTAIMEYVDEAFPGPSLRPTARDERWHVALENTHRGELLEDSRRKAAIGVRKVEDSLSKSNWLAGSACLLAEIDALSLIDPLRDLARALLDGAARTRSRLRRIGMRPAAKAALGARKTGRPRQAYTPGHEHSRWGY